VGGGISGLEEIHGLRDQGAAAVLVGSALHNGRVSRRELDQLSGNIYIILYYCVILASN
jgi:phosphoribosylformimino-5-aminoimidazole carboxamide ribotide isomerase